MRIAYIVILCAIAGCASPTDEMRRQSAIETQQMELVCNTAWNSPELQAIHEAIPMAAPNASTAQLADSAYVNPRQQQALLDYDRVMAPCLDVRRRIFQRDLPPAALVSYDSLRANLRVLRAELWAKRISIGQYNTQALNITLSSYKEVQASTERANAAALQQQQIQNQNMLMMLPYVTPPAPRPSTTDCYAFGNSVSCTTR